MHSIRLTENLQKLHNLTDLAIHSSRNCQLNIIAGWKYLILT